VAHDRDDEEHLPPTQSLFERTRGEHASVPGFRLEVLQGPDQGARFVAKSDRVVIGTHRSNDFVLSDDTVSRFHCALAVENEHVVLRDLDSRNGTCVEGVSVLAAHLLGPSTLALGKTRIRFEPIHESVIIPLATHDRFGALVGRSPKIRAVFAILERAALSHATVLLQGETGTGKDLAAESIHQKSERRDGPFAVVDCGAIPPNLLESELFGHEKGAFTGAIDTRIGAFESASGGTLFLDEVGELGLELQPKLLRALESRKIQRIGSTRPIKVDVRVIAATNRNLEAEVNAQRFRSDLYYRLAVVVVRLPALRERLEDIPLLVDEILSSMGMPLDHPRTAPLRGEAVLTELEQHPWPGNVRELRNYIERSLLLDEKLPLSRSAEQHGPPSIDTKEPLRAARERWIRYFERTYLEALLREHDDNVAAAARAAKTDRVHFHRLLARVGLR
jgi:transcriptional regulator with GAF, ATPase, and Fis domain